MTLLMDEGVKDKLIAAKSVQEFLGVIDAADKKMSVETQANTSQGYRILAVTSCPTGIAHTYMAAEALEKAGARLGCPLKAETNGSGGAKNVLTDEEIAGFLHRKWIVPVCQGINGSLTAVLSALETAALALSQKYAVSYQQIDDEIAQANEELSQLVSQLTGDAFAIKGLEALIKQQ